MKFSFLAPFLLTSSIYWSLSAAQHEGELGCTHGKLYVSDDSTTTIHIIDVSKGNLGSLTPESTITVAGGPGEIHLDHSASGKEVATIYRGQADVGYTDGVVNFVNTGVTVDDHGDHKDIAYAAPSLVDNAAVECSRAIHFVRHDGKIAIFCDGAYEESVFNNSTVWVLGESKFGSSTESAIVFNTTLVGSHHGVAIPVDDNHVLHSLATQDRIDRTPEGDSYSLPSTFQVIDYEGNVLHSLTDTSDPALSCSGFHGSSAVDDTFALACDAEHGGILIVNYNRNQETYSSRALSYPEGYDSHRTGTFQEHPDAPFILGNFAETGNQYHLMAFQATDAALSDEQLLPLDDQQCGFAFEQGEAEVVLAFMPTGVLHAFEFENGNWAEIAKTQVVTNMQTCDEGFFVPGIGQAFVFVKASQELHAVDLEHIHEGEMKVVTSSLGFTPYAAVVAGAPADVACQLGDHGHDHDHGDETSTSAAVHHALSFGVLFLVVMML